MTHGHYRINLLPTDVWRPDQERAKRWSLYVNTCRMLHRDGLRYNVELHLTGERPHIVIRSSGKPIKGKSKLAKMKRSLVPAIEHATCAKRLTVATNESYRLKQGMRGRMNQSYYWKTWRYQHAEDWQKFAARRKVFSTWLRKRLSSKLGAVRFDVTPQDYKELDALAGCRIKRVSEYSATYRPASIRQLVLRDFCRSDSARNADTLDEPKYVVARREQATKDQKRQPIKPYAFQQYQDAMLDVEYWREMELLSGQREHFKPGLTADRDSQYQNDEVAA